MTLINQVYVEKQLVSYKAENNAEQLKKSFMDVSIPVYVYRKYEKMNPHLLHLTEVSIGRDKLKLVWVDKEVYDETRGLYFRKIKIEEQTFEVI